MTLSFGLRVPTAGLPQETAEYAARVEGAGFDFLWMPEPRCWRGAGAMSMDT